MLSNRAASTAVTPAIATADSEVTLTGQVINTGAETVPAPDVRLNGSFTPLAGRDAIAAWAAGRPSAIETSLIDHFSTTGDLRPGGRANFILTVPAPGPEGAAFGALPMAISVAGTQLRTFVPMQRRMEYEPLRLAVLVPLTLDPDPALLGTYAAPRLAAWRTQLADTSRFQRLLDATEDLPVTWAIDPTLLNPPSAIPDVRPTEAEAGAAWDRITSAQREEARLRRTADTALRARLAGHSPLLLPYADADLAGLLNLPGQSGLIAPALAATRTIAKGLPGARTDILWPADNRVGTDRVRALLTAAGQPGIRAVLGPESALPDKNTDQAPHPGPNGSAVLTYDDRLGNLLLTLPADGSRAGSPGGASRAPDRVAPRRPRLDGSATEVLPDGGDRGDGGHQPPTQTGERVLDGRRLGRHDRARDDLFRFELAEPLAEHPRRDRRDVPAQLREAAGTTAQVPDHVRGPRAGEELHARGERALGDRADDVVRDADRAAAELEGHSR